MKPLYDKVLIKPDDPEQKTKGGIIIAENAVEKAQKGTVVEVGFGRLINGKIVPLAVQKGAKVLYSKYAGEEIKVNDDKLIILNEDDIMGVYDE